MNEPETVVSHSPVTEPSPEPEAQNADVIAPANDPPAEEQTVVQPVTNEVASVGDPAASVQVDAAPPVSGATPTRDVITALAYFFIALTDDDASFIEIPGELLSLLGFPPDGRRSDRLVDCRWNRRKSFSRCACTRPRVHSWLRLRLCRQAGPRCSLPRAIRPACHLPVPSDIRRRGASAPVVWLNNTRLGSKRCWRPGALRRRCGQFSNTPLMPCWPRCPCWRWRHWLRRASLDCCFLAPPGCSSGIAKPGRLRCCGLWGSLASRKQDRWASSGQVASSPCMLARHAQHGDSHPEPANCSSLSPESKPPALTVDERGLELDTESRQIVLPPRRGTLRRPRERAAESVDGRPHERGCPARRRRVRRFEDLQIELVVAQYECGLHVVGRAVDEIGIETRAFMQRCHGLTLRSRRPRARRAEGPSFSPTTVGAGRRPRHDVAADESF